MARPTVWVRSRLAGEVPSVEFLECGVEVVRVEHDDCHDLSVPPDLGDAQRLALKCLCALVTGRPSDATENETLPSGRDELRNSDRDPEVGGLTQFRNHDITTRPQPGIHHATAIVAKTVVGQNVGHRRPVLGAQVRKEAFGRLACGVLKPPCLQVQLVEPGERGVEVFLIEQLDTG